MRLALTFLWPGLLFSCDNPGVFHNTHQTLGQMQQRGYPEPFCAAASFSGALDLAARDARIGDDGAWRNKLNGPGEYHHSHVASGNGPGPQRRA